MSQARSCSDVHRLGETMCSTAVVVSRIVILTNSGLSLVADEFPGGLEPTEIPIGLICGGGPTRLLLVLVLVLLRPESTATTRRGANSRHCSTAPQSDGGPAGQRLRGHLVIVVSIIIVWLRSWSCAVGSCPPSASATWFRVGQPWERSYRRGLSGVTCCTAARDRGGGLLLLLLLACAQWGFGCCCVVGTFTFGGRHGTSGTWDIWRSENLGKPSLQLCFRADGQLLGTVLAIERNSFIITFISQCIPITHLHRGDHRDLPMYVQPHMPIT